MIYRLIVIAYFSASAVALFFGASLMAALWSMGAFSLVVLCVLGPIASLSYVIRGGIESPLGGESSVLWPAAFFYLIATALLVSCLVLSTRKKRSARIVGYVAAAIVWVVSALLTFGVLME